MGYKPPISPRDGKVAWLWGDTAGRTMAQPATTGAEEIAKDLGNPDLLHPLWQSGLPSILVNEKPHKPHTLLLLQSIRVPHLG